MKYKLIKSLIWGGILLCVLKQPAYAVDFTALTGGFDTDDDVLRIDLSTGWDWNKNLLSVGYWSLGGYWETALSYWDGDAGRTGNDSLISLSLTPVLRFDRTSQSNGISPYAEIGVGIHLLSENKIENKDFDINFAFGNHLGAGILFGKDQQFEMGYRFQHISNAGLGDSNPGINFHLLRFSYHY